MAEKRGKSYEELVRILGRSMAEKLSIDLGGTCLYFYAATFNLEKQVDLIRSIGLENAKRLEAECDEQVIRVPVAGAIQARNRMVCKLTIAGYKTKEIARLLGLVERHVQLIKKEGIPRELG
jgi:DNA-directed RNA polymerase specialized sigma subunit